MNTLVCDFFNKGGFEQWLLTGSSNDRDPKIVYKFDIKFCSEPKFQRESLTETKLIKTSLVGRGKGKVFLTPMWNRVNLADITHMTIVLLN